MEQGPPHRGPLIAGAFLLALVLMAIGLSNGKVVGIHATGLAPGATPTKPAPVDPIAQDPQPTLLSDSVVAMAKPILDKEQDATLDGVQEFWGTEKGRAAEDSSFDAWLAITAPEEPSSSLRSDERAELADVEKSDQNSQAAAWLTLHGCKDVWMSYAVHDAQGGVRDTIRKELNDLFTLSGQVATAVQKHYDPTGLPTAACTGAQPANTACACTYPSPATIYATAAQTYLSRQLPRYERKYGAMANQVAAAGLYQRRELASDVDEGARLGYLIGRYFNITRGYGDDSEAPASTATPTP